MENAATKFENLLAEQNQLVLQSPEWYSELQHAVAWLIQHDFNRLVQTLYRIDVDETRLKNVLALEASQPTEDLIAALIVERMIQSLQTKKQWAEKRNDIPDEDRWNE